MTETEWRTADGGGNRMLAVVRDRLSARKWVLVACGVAREYSPEAYLPLVEEVEASVDRPLTPADLNRLNALLPEPLRHWLRPDAPEGGRVFGSTAELGNLLRELYEGGFWPNHAGLSRALAHTLREQLGNPFRPYCCEPTWRSETVLALASAVDGTSAFDRLPILADALEDAGCDERSLLDHLRGPGPHARGCWALDLILNRDPELFAEPPLLSTPRRMRLGPFTPPPEGIA
ncbi:MAG: hypothetical protein MUF18_05360 [Fimbriiglobus sp.]|jgi:hypothetical protein|nr:hypothetical protein [Fimbriiglobus sp.]